jgi:hypothetical protein
MKKMTSLLNITKLDATRNIEDAATTIIQESIVTDLNSFTSKDKGSVAYGQGSGVQTERQF